VGVFRIGKTAKGHGANDRTVDHGKRSIEGDTGGSPLQEAGTLVGASKEQRVLPWP
jgi:hypothetical protein